MQYKQPNVPSLANYGSICKVNICSVPLSLAPSPTPSYPQHMVHQLNSLPPSQLNSLAPSQLNSLAPSQLNSLAPSQLNSLAPSPTNMGQDTPPQISKNVERVSLGRREWTLDFKLHWYPKFYENITLFINLKTLGTSNEFLFDYSKMIVSKFFNQ